MCANRVYCSNYTSNTNMQLLSCPYSLSQCGGKGSSLVLSLGQSITTNTANMTKFSDCFWTIQGNDLKNGSAVPDYSYISVTFNRVVNLTLFVNNGTSLTSLND